MQMSGADLIVNLLERQGIRTVVGIPGGSNLPLYDALARHGGIRHVLARHEQGAGFIAQGMARVSGRPQVCFATSGPGATNILTAIADARLDSIPLVCITGQVPRAMIGTDAFQEVDTYGMSVPITKHNFLVRTPRELLDIIPAAFRIAASGRPGPVLIDVPKDVQSEIDKLRRAHLGMVSDIRDVLEAFLPLVVKNQHSPWPGRIANLKKCHPLPASGLEDFRAPRFLIHQAAKLLDDNAIVTTDVGQHQMWTAQTFPFRGSQQWLTSGGLGTMGFGIPAAIGASLVAPERTVLCFSGDGSAMMNIQELATAVEVNANVKILLMNNNSLGLVRQQQSLFFDNRRFASTFSRPVDFAAIARGFGMSTWDLANAEYPQRLLAEALNTQGPALIHAPIRETDVLPMVPPGEANKNMIQGECHACPAN